MEQEHIFLPLQAGTKMPVPNENREGVGIEAPEWSERASTAPLRRPERADKIRRWTECREPPHDAAQPKGK